MTKLNTFTLTRWIMFTWLGWFIGIFLLIALSSALDAAGIERVQFHIAVGLGTGIGFFQWRILKKELEAGAQWIWSYILGMGIPFLLIDIFTYFSAGTREPYYLPLSILLASLVTGIVQYQFLKKYSPKAHRWIIASILGWTLAGATVLSMDYIKLAPEYNLVSFFINLTLILGGGIVLGFVSGKFLLSVLRS